VQPRMVWSGMTHNGGDWSGSQTGGKLKGAAPGSGSKRNGKGKKGNDAL